MEITCGEVFRSAKQNFVICSTNRLQVNMKAVFIPLFDVANIFFGKYAVFSKYAKCGIHPGKPHPPVIQEGGAQYLAACGIDKFSGAYEMNVGVVVQGIAAFVERGDTPGLPFFSGIPRAFQQFLPVHARCGGDQIFTEKTLIEQRPGHRARQREGRVHVGERLVHDVR